MNLIKILSLLLVFSSFTNFAFSQYKVSPNKYAIKFVDKNNSPYNLDKPSEFLSEKALQRRQKYGIDLNWYDLPVTPQYVDSLKNMGFKIHGISKWHNCVVVTVDSTCDIQLLKNVSFVDYDFDWRKNNPKPNANSETLKRPKLKKDNFDYSLKLKYGNADNQTQMLNIQILHNLGYLGQGMTIAVLDAGFTKANELPVFKKMFEENRILGVYDFVENDYEVYDAGNHGMNVLSCIAADLPDKMIGTAPKISAYLFKTEDENSEYLVEEFNWSFAVEKADSLGVDIIHSSLGYQDFDDDETSYTHPENNGDVSISTKAADIAVSKGIFVNVSAGNEGNDPWEKVSSPADADSCFAVGAVDNKGIIAYFSSHGPTFDGRIKPDGCAKGYNATVQNIYGRISTASGTSFAGPIMAGCIACLMQAHPNAKVMDIVKALHLAGSIYNKPNNEYGYGITDFAIAHKILLKWKM
ncbi:MAG: S8 family serine peptidase [Bacteroidales bacterium]|nr:S8 family serine peptidase [Bacteroidales bacterium]